MDDVRLCTTGAKVSRILGMTLGDAKRGADAWTIDEESSRPLIRQALEIGINFLDTANIYSDGTSEEIVRCAIKDFDGTLRLIALLIGAPVEPEPSLLHGLSVNTRHAARRITRAGCSARRHGC